MRVPLIRVDLAPFIRTVIARAAQINAPKLLGGGRPEAARLRLSITRDMYRRCAHSKSNSISSFSLNFMTRAAHRRLTLSFSRHSHSSSRNQPYHAILVGMTSPSSVRRGLRSGALSDRCSGATALSTIAAGSTGYSR